MRYLLLTLSLVSAPQITFAGPPHVKDAVKAKEWACSGVSHGILKDTGKRDSKAFPLCIVDVTCRAKWDIEGFAKDQGFVHSVSCKPKDGACPATDTEVRDCVTEANSDNRDYTWESAAISPRATRENGNGLSCRYVGTGENETAWVILRAMPNPKGGYVFDGVCAGKVNCRPEVTPSVVTCPPRRSGDQADDFVCPKAVDCVSERFTLEKPKVEVAARPHTGTPAKTVSTSGSGDTHTTVGDKR